MKTASVRDLRQDFARVLAWVQAGEEVAITRRRQAVARLIPLPHPKRVKRPMPDLAARLAMLTCFISPRQCGLGVSSS